MAEEAAVVQEDRKSVIAAALETADKQVAEEVKEPEVKEEPKKEEPAKVEPVKVDEDALLAEQGKQLMLALKDPAKAPIVLKFFAEQAGYTKPPETKAEVKEVQEDIVSILKESLGDEFAFLADKLAPAMKKILTKELEASQRDIREQFKAQEADKLKAQSADAIEKLGGDFFGKGTEIPSNVMDEMSKFMDRTTPAANMTVKEYVADAFHFAVGKLGLVKANPKKEERTNKNRTDAASRLASDRSPSEEGLKEARSKPMSRQEAIRAAVEAASKG